jgi:hypothetical protein
MSLPTDIVWRSRGGNASFEYKIGADIGRRFDEYTHLDSGTAPDAMLSASAVADVEAHAEHTSHVVTFHCGGIDTRLTGARALSESQIAVLEWVFGRTSDFVGSVMEMVCACYTEKKPEGWWDQREAPPPHGARRDCIFYGGVPAVPVLPAGQAVQEFVRISDIYLTPHDLTCGVRMKVAWSKGVIGLRYQGRRSKKKGTTSEVFFRCVGVGPSDIAKI